MRRIGMALLAFFGIACIAAAITIPTYLVPKLKVVPLDLDITTDSTSIAALNNTGERFPAVIFDRCSVSKDKAAQLTVSLKQQRRSVVVEPSNDSQATIEAGQTVLIDRIQGKDGEERQPKLATSDGDRKCDDALLTANVDRVSLDRKSSAPNGAVSSLQLEAAPDGVPVEDVSVPLEKRQGFQYKFGFDVKKRDYYYYDLNTRSDAVAKFVDEKTINGVKVYHFKAEVPETNISNLPNPKGEAPLGTILTMPAKWWGITADGLKPEEPITMHRHAAAVRHVWVEPTTGTIVDGYEEQHQYFKSPEGTEDLPKEVNDFRMDALKANFKLSDKTVKEQTDRASSYIGQLKWGGLYAPIILGVLGALLLALWALLLFRGRGDDADGDDPRDGHPTGDDAAEPELSMDKDDQRTQAFGAGAAAAAPTSDLWSPAPPPETDPQADTVVLPPLPDPNSTQSIPRHMLPD
ncbi:MAG: DUF3068 domain-containing protein [Gordonia sp. (in: high G+C Gram-positive bacteria)]|uniref:DUF3068 domain-containing protein n=1 Tax=Gordonia sp. (in: high G+C Gram-positive bacteria) TaxID=84139 RepID=UPI0039E66299